MTKQEKQSFSAFPPLAIVFVVLICLGLVVVPSLRNKIIDSAMAVSLVIAVGSLTYAVIATLYTKRFSPSSAAALFVGTLFYASSVICYTFGSFPLSFLLGSQIKCSWGLVPNQAAHGLAMLGLGLWIILIAIRSLRGSKERKHAEKILAYVLLGLGAVQFVVGMIALISR